MRKRGSHAKRDSEDDEVIDLRERLAPYHGSVVQPLTREQRLAGKRRPLRARPF